MFRDCRVKGLFLFFDIRWVYIVKFGMVLFYSIVLYFMFSFVEDVLLK